MIVSIVTRTAYREEHFPGLNSTRVNRDAGHPGQGVEPRGRRDTQCFSHLNHCPPHSVSKRLGFPLKRRLSGVPISCRSVPLLLYWLLPVTLAAQDVPRLFAIVEFKRPVAQD